MQFLVFVVVFVSVAGSSIDHAHTPFFKYYSPGVSIITKKSKNILPIGTVEPGSPAALTQDFIESIPPEARLQMIHIYSDTTWSSRRYLMDLTGKTQGATSDNYMKLLRKSITMNPGIYRLLARYAAHGLSSHRHLDSASAIVAHIQSRFPNGEFDHLTPEYIFDWYSTIGGGSGRLFCTTDPIIRRRIEKKQPTILADPDMVLGIDLPAVRTMLNLRRSRLELTGYEFAL